MHSHDMTLPHRPLEDPTFDMDPMPYIEAARRQHPWRRGSNAKSRLTFGSTMLGVEEDLQVDQCIQNTGTQSQHVAGDRITANSVPLVSVGTGQSPG